MVNVAVVLNTTKKLSNNEYPVSLRVTHQYKRKYYPFSTILQDQSLRFRCTSNLWKPADAEDNGLGKFKKGHATYKPCNEILESKLSQAKRIIQEYDKQGVTFRFEQFELDLKRKSVPLITSLQEYYGSQIKILDEQGRVGLSGLNLENKRMLEKFRPNALLTDVNVRFLETFEYWMRNERRNKDTTISVKIRNLQRIINQAIEDKLFSQSDYPFGEKKYSVNKRLDTKTKKIAVNLNVIGKLKELNLQSGSWLHLSLNMFLFSYYSRGMNFVDMTYLTWKNISDTHIDTFQPLRLFYKRYR